MLSKSQVILLVVGLYVSVVVSADVDCSKRPERVDPKTCCPLPDFVTSELKEKCKQYDVTPSPPPMSAEESSESKSTASGEGKRHRHHHPHPPPCFFSCVFNETGIYVDNKLDENKLKSYVQVAYKDSTELQKTVTESFTTCVAKAAEFKDKMGDKMGRPSPPPGLPSCPRGAGHLAGCVFKNTFKNCPASIWNDTKQCNDMREHFRNCKRPHGPPSTMPMEDDN